VLVWLQAGQLQQLDDWRREESDLPSRAEAIRRLIERGLSARAGCRNDAPVGEAERSMASRFPVPWRIVELQNGFAVEDARLRLAGSNSACSTAGATRTPRGTPAS
jgi:hypothetical protein